jgi:hypothetical protein
MFKHDGAVRPAALDDLQPGAVLRRVESDGSSVSPFSDCVILNVWNQDLQHGRTLTWVKVARPYVFASSVGTTAPTPLLGCETFDMTLDGALASYSVVLRSTGEPSSYTT